MMKSRLNKLVLCVNSQSLLAGLWRAGSLHGSQSFARDDAGHAAFAEFLTQHISVPVYLMADAVEEDYHLENLPHAAGAANKALIARKLNQIYRGSEYRTAHFLNREQGKRRENKYLFVALNNAEFIQEWVNIIQALKAKLVGIYLLPMLSQVIAKQLKLSAPHLLLSENLSSGLRQTYLHNGELRMSRLVPNTPASEEKLTKFYVAETEKTRLYLVSQRFITRETPLELMLLSIDGLTQNISKSISQAHGIACTDVNLNQLTSNLNLPINLIDKMPELLHMQLLANGQVVDNLATEELTKEYDFSRLKQNIKMAATLLGIAGLLGAGMLWMQGLSAQSTLQEVTQDTVLQQHRYDEAAKNFPVTPISAEDLRTAVALDKTVALYPKSPRRMMQVVSAALEQVPEVQLNRIHWALTNDMNIQDNDKLISLPATGAPAPNSTFTAQPSKLYELSYITAEIAGFTGDYRGALNSVHNFVTKLEKNANVAAVEVLQEPVNVSSYVNLQGTTTDAQAVQTQPAIFKLKVILKAPEATLENAGVK